MVCFCSQKPTIRVIRNTNVVFFFIQFLVYKSLIIPKSVLSLTLPVGFKYSNFAYIFDPYYLEEDYYYGDDDVAIVLHESFSHNRLVKIERLFDERMLSFSLLKKEDREVILINK